MTAAQADDTVRQLCKGLQHSGLKPGDCVTICSFNNVSPIWCKEIKRSQVAQRYETSRDNADHAGLVQILYPCLWLGVIGTGGVVAGVNPALTVSELKHHLAITGTRFLIVHETCFKQISQAAAECGIGAASIYLFDDGLISAEHEICSSDGSEDNDGVLPDAQSEDNSLDGDSQAPRQLKAILKLGHGQWRTFTQQDATATPALHATTSGTTGLPKAAVIPHQYLVSQSVMLEDQCASREEMVSSRRNGVR